VRNGSHVEAAVDSVTSTARCTTLGANGFEISTVEHLLAALSALGVGSADVRVEGPEVPALDGSALGFVEALREAGTTPLDGRQRILLLRGPVYLERGHSSLLALPSDRFRVTVAVRYDHPMIGSQVADIVVGPEVFEREIAPARTFGFHTELQELARLGLARGGSVDNAVVFLEEATSSPLRFPDEPVRHKALDVIGDLALLGAVPMAHIVAMRPSHRLNVEFARELMKRGELTTSDN
jgi:UDP-3-O-[3-hydroxymyristoyl] N-acetylglucosamine deacetylase